MTAESHQFQVTHLLPVILFKAALRIGFGIGQKLAQVTDVAIFPICLRQQYPRTVSVALSREFACLSPSAFLFRLFAQATLLALCGNRTLAGRSLTHEGPGGKSHSKNQRCSRGRCSGEHEFISPNEFPESVSRT